MAPSSRKAAAMLELESALVILVPEAEALVGPFRDLHDAGAALGVPAHITVLYPFKPPEEINEAVLDRLRHLFFRFEPFDFVLTTIRRFPGEALYLVPKPEEPFGRLTRAAWKDRAGRDRRRRRPCSAPIPGILRRRHPPQEHSHGLLPGRLPLLYLGRAARICARQSSTVLTCPTPI